MLWGGSSCLGEKSERKSEGSYSASESPWNNLGSHGMAAGLRGCLLEK